MGHRTAPSTSDEPSRLAANQLQLTVTDLVAEAHDTPHPMSTGIYHEDHRPEAARCVRGFIDERIPRYPGYFESILARNGGEHLVGGSISSVDLSLFRVLSGLAYAFPKAMARTEKKIPNLVALRDRVAARPNIAAYGASPRRLSFSTEGIFRHYPALDHAPANG